jgi:electron transport complex protein RnfE
MGLGYTVSIIIMSAIRQVLATGILSFDNPFDITQNIFSITLIPEDFTISMFSQPVGAFCTFALLAAALSAYKTWSDKKAAQKAAELAKKEKEAEATC